MPAKTITSTRVIDYTKRLYNTYNGNPRYRVYFTDGTNALTKSDASCAYDLFNLSHGDFKGRTLLIGWTKAGRIETIELLEDDTPETQEEYMVRLTYATRT